MKHEIIKSLLAFALCIIILLAIQGIMSILNDKDFLLMQIKTPIIISMKSDEIYRDLKKILTEKAEDKPKKRNNKRKRKGKRNNKHQTSK